MRAIPLVIRFFALCVNLAIIATACAAGDPDKDPQMPALLQDARKSIDAKKIGPAIEQCDKVIVAFKTYYGNGKQKIYCAESSTESLSYLLKHAAATNNHTITLTPEMKPPADSKDAIVLSPTWARAYFMKGYTLQEQGQFAEAKSALQMAVELSPANCQYISEFAGIFVQEKDWPRALELFKRAEESAGITSEKSKTNDLGRAHRGMGYVLVEQGKLDEAEQKYQQCLTDDPTDARAKRELEYIRSLRAKKTAR